jgi:hypothetical protein
MLLPALTLSNKYEISRDFLNTKRYVPCCLTEAFGWGKDLEGSNAIRTVQHRVSELIKALMYSVSSRIIRIFLFEITNSIYLGKSLLKVTYSYMSHIITLI